MNPQKILIILSCVGLSFILNLYGILEFNTWPQIEDLHSSNLNLAELSDHPHFYRYIISLPGLYMRDTAAEFGFSLYTSFFMIASIYLMSSSLKDKHPFIIFIACAAIFSSHLFMNGRGAISWLGWMVILSIISSNKTALSLIRVSVLLFALLCCSVSSGTFTVAFSAVLTFLLAKAAFEQDWRAVLYAVAVYILYKDLAIEGIERNLIYYSLGTGNPIMNMLEHGLGAIVRDNSISFAVLLAILFILATIFLYSLKNRIRLWEFISISYPLLGGVFGYSTLTLMLPSLILAVSSRIGRLAQGRRKQGIFNSSRQPSRRTQRALIH